jgi:hypothetical protein
VNDVLESKIDNAVFARRKNTAIDNKVKGDNS